MNYYVPQEDDFDVNSLHSVYTPTSIFRQHSSGEKLFLYIRQREWEEELGFSGSTHEIAKCPNRVGIAISNVWMNGTSIKKDHALETWCPFPLAGITISIAYRGHAPNIVYMPKYVIVFQSQALNRNNIMKTPSSGQVKGYEVDVVEILSKKLGFNFYLSEQSSWGARLPGNCS